MSEIDVQKWKAALDNAEGIYYSYSQRKAVWNNTTQGAFWQLGQEWKRLVKHIKRAIKGKPGTVIRLAHEFAEKMKSEIPKK